MIEMNGKIADIKLGSGQVIKVYIGDKTIWTLPVKFEVVPFTLIDSVGSKTYYKLKAETGKTITVYLDESAYMDVGIYPDDSTLVNGKNMSDTHTFKLAYGREVTLTIWGGAKVTKILSGGQIDL